MLQSHLGPSIMFYYMFHLRHWGAFAGTIQCESLKLKQTQVSCQDANLHLCFDNKSMSYNEESWTLMTRRRPHKKQESHPYPNLPRNEQHKQNIRRYPKKKEEKKNLKENKRLYRLMTSWYKSSSPLSP